MSCCYPVPSPEMVSTLSLAVQKIALVLLQWRDQSEKRFAHMELELQQLKGHIIYLMTIIEPLKYAY